MFGWQAGRMADWLSFFASELESWLATWIHGRRSLARHAAWVIGIAAAWYAKFKLLIFGIDLKETGV